MGVSNPEPASNGHSSAFATPSKKRKSAPSSSDRNPAANAVVIDLTCDTPPSKRKKRNDPNEEKRLRRWRPQPPQSYQAVCERALTQRMFVVDRQRDADAPGHPVETIKLAGTTGNVYTITIDKVPSCDCPHARQGNQCKHIVYVLARVLRAPEHLQYQLALLSNELREIFAGAPALPSRQGDETEKDGVRKPVEGECPICCVDFEPDSGEVIVYCKASCGNNIHQDCFKRWAATKQRQGDVTCPFCRATWEGEQTMLQDLAKAGKVNDEGYVNVAAQLGLSGERDCSTYNRFFVRRHFGYWQ